mgnify:CR=1 FL=1|tara:strand:- start:427 stop:834 length:408 start_codon:yes stop_codon:yes gene_type:complete
MAQSLYYNTAHYNVKGRCPGEPERNSPPSSDWEKFQPLDYKLQYWCQPHQSHWMKCEDWDEVCDNLNSTVRYKETFTTNDAGYEKCMTHKYGNVYAQGTSWQWCEIEAHCEQNDPNNLLDPRNKYCGEISNIPQR